MAKFDDKEKDPNGVDSKVSSEGASMERHSLGTGGAGIGSVDSDVSEDGIEPDDEELAVGELGSDRYVFAAFFAAGGLGAFLIGRITAAIWNSLAENPAVVREFPQLLRLSEDERPTYTMLFGVVIATFLVISNVRKVGVRSWAEGVASELGKVHWPDRETVTNGTVVVIAAGIFATLYIGLLDRLWGFVTMLVYGT